MGKLNIKGQSTIEFTILIIIVIGALLTIQNYFKRGIQGRLKKVADDVGDQYDPQLSTTRIRHSLESNTLTTISTMNSAGGFWTDRFDETNSTESKTGTILIDSE